MKVSRGNQALLEFLHKSVQLAAALHASEGRAAPHSPGDELEGSGADLLAGASHADDRRLAPALVAALKGGAHHLNVADALKGVIHPAFGELEDHLLDRSVELAGIDAVGGAEHESREGKHQQARGELAPVGEI